MNRIVYSIVLLIVFGFTASAQNVSTINGNVKDDKGKALSNVTVSLLFAKDSSLIKAAVTDAEGHYEIVTAQKVNCLLYFSSVAHTAIYSNTINLTDI